MSESLALFTSSRAARYGVFLPRWWNAISKLERQPDQIVIVCHSSNLARVPESVPVEYESRVKVVFSDSEVALDYPNLCVGSTDTDWVAFCGLDDQVLPNAYDEITNCEAEILVGNIRLSDGSDFKGSWDLNRLRVENPLPALSPFRKSLWERVGGWPHVYWADWGFWMKCAMADATAVQSTKLQALFDLGEQHETESGRLLSAETRDLADIEIRAFAKEIGFAS
jgi:hypothetical protein